MPTFFSASDCSGIDRFSPSRRPAESAIGYHRWTNLLFVHWRFPAEVVRTLLPPEVMLDTWEGDAWVGLVPFYMSRVRPWWSPSVPGVSNFCEVNVRTYVHFHGRNPGVWFFSLDASQSLAVLLARWNWHLPYFRAQMIHNRTDSVSHYQSRRLWPGTAGPGCDIRARIGSPLEPAAANRPVAAGPALPGTLEHFLLERYILYTQPMPKQLLACQVHHSPYPLRNVRLEEFDESLLAATGLSHSSAPCHAIFSDGVDVEIFPLLPCLTGPSA